MHRSDPQRWLAVNVVVATCASALLLAGLATKGVEALGLAFALVLIRPTGGHRPPAIKEDLR